MTSYKPYNPNKDTRPSIVSIGCEIATRAQIETDCHRLVPVNTRIIFLNIPYDKAYLPNGGADYKFIAELLKDKGYGASWSIHSVWTVCDDDPF